MEGKLEIFQISIFLKSKPKFKKISIDKPIFFNV